jgi:hypothetical protein
MTNQKTITELKRISKKHGILRPEDVIKEAEKLSSPLHSSFEWDDKIASHEYRLEQARKLIRVTVEYLKPANNKSYGRVFVSLTSDRGKAGGGYRETVTVLSNSVLRNQFLHDALEELERIRLKYGHLKELAGIFTALKKVKNSRSMAA